MAEVLLSAQKVPKRFGGLAAVNGVSVDLWRGKIHTVIRPNGAAKSTLTNLLSGDLPPTSGQVLLGGTNVTGWAPERTSRQGLGPQLAADHLPADHRARNRAPGRPVARCAAAL